MDKTLTKTIGNLDDLIKLFGTYDENIAIIESELNVSITTIGSNLNIRGDEENVNMASDIIDTLFKTLNADEPLKKKQVMLAIELARTGNLEDISGLMSIVAITARGKRIKCKTLGQKKYVQAIKDNPIVFGVGPAGTGKTYLAVALAVMAYKNKEVERIILTRPAVEAGEKLGFLPGDLEKKVDPYLRPLYDALSEMFGLETYMTLIERGVIEIAPLAYMRGRTLNNAFIILDEAQNTTKEQMKMFLTRMGEGSKVVVTGDVTQIDLPTNKMSGLLHAIKVLKNIKGININMLTHKDVVRHELVQNIIMAYENSEKARKGS
ncbi:MAG: PhoH family protein [Christensenellales bacterium]